MCPEGKGKKMYKTLALSYIVSVYLASSQVPRGYRPLICLTCADVQPDGKCANKSGSCITKQNELCYNRMVSWNYEVLFVDRGCTSKCRRLQENSNYRNFTFCCGSTPKCNNVNIWDDSKYS
ncbi:acrosomal protein SP-10-like [Podarcis raffonei]|uniref:acrosomal protein SP-10-like n=1 Tax=Podarcis raffonei TaxID=65483 RepID=UPI0023292AEB|nr:acrosomal protein SP-10-like [Podarcis raffonei]